MTVAQAHKVIHVAVDKGNTQEKLTATSDATNAKAVLAGTTVRNVGSDNTLIATQANYFINLAVFKSQDSGEADGLARYRWVTEQSQC